jgi:hypothetical protein
MADVKTSTGGSEDETILYIPFAGRIDVEEIEKQQAKKTKKQKVVKAVEPDPIVEPVAVEPEQEIIPEQWVKPESEYTQVDWAAVNDPPEPGVTDVAATPTGVNVVRRGFTTLQMALAFRNSLRDPADYLIVEVRESAGFALEGPILCHYVAHKTEEL